MPGPPKGEPVNVKPEQVVKPKVEKEEEDQDVAVKVAPPETKKETKPLKVAEFGKYKLKSAFSLTKSEEEKKAEEEGEEDLTGKPRTPFTLEQLQGKWKSFCYKLQKEKKAGIYATLTKHPVELKDNFQLELLIDSEIQELELNNHRAELLGFLRKELNNYGIDLKTIVNAEQNETKHLTSKDKFLAMVEKNPVLSEMRDRLGLDLEY